MRIDHANSRWGAPRLVGTAAVLFAVLVAVLLSVSGAFAAAGPTDLSITKTDSPDPVIQGSNLTYTIRVTNSGANDATSVVVTDNLPPGSEIDFISASSTAGTCQHTGNTVTCDLGQVNSGTTTTVTIVVKAKKSGTISNTATVASPDDTDASNNSATAVTTVNKQAKGPKKPKGRPSCGAPTISGTAGDDVITGTSHGDVIATFGGNDQVFAGGGATSFAPMAVPTWWPARTETTRSSAALGRTG